MQFHGKDVTVRPVGASKKSMIYSLKDDRFFNLILEREHSKIFRFLKDAIILTKI